MNAVNLRQTNEASMALADRPNDSEQTLDLLGAVEHDAHASQRRLSLSLGVALGLTNALIKRCVRKGLIKVKTIPAGRYGYYLTPRGFSEKSRLTAEYLKISLDFFRRARCETNELLTFAAQQGWRRIALAGTGEMAEIATLAARENGIELVGILDPGDNRPSFGGLPVTAIVAELGQVDAILLTDIRHPQQVYDTLANDFPSERILIPAIMRIRRRKTTAEPV
ncbi:MAG: winged helix-turn-helix transcriptional regulator [Alphaproteobacteria bacterium]